MPGMHLAAAVAVAASPVWLGKRDCACSKAARLGQQDFMATHPSILYACSNAAKYLAQRGLVDEKRLCIDGGSAGGYTTLACLAFRLALT